MSKSIKTIEIYDFIPNDLPKTPNNYIFAGGNHSLDNGDILLFNNYAECINKYNNTSNKGIAVKISIFNYINRDKLPINGIGY